MRVSMFCALIVFSFGCGDEGSDGVGDEGNGPNGADPVGDDRDDDDDDTAAPPPPPPSWSGRWRAEIAYSVVCRQSGSERRNSGTHTWALGFRGDADDLTVDVDGSDFYILRGNGTATGLTLCGNFPMFDDRGNVARSGPQNRICLTIDEVESDTLTHGYAEGQFEGQFGIRCELERSDLLLRK